MTLPALKSNSNTLYNINVNKTLSPAENEAIADYIAAFTYRNVLKNRHIYLILRANSTYARLFIGGGMKRRPTDQRLVVDLTNAVDITYIVGILTGQKQDKDNGVELPKYANERTWHDRALSIVYYLNDSLGEITGESIINEKLVHIADARGVIIWQERYNNYKSFYPQEKQIAI